MNPRAGLVCALVVLSSYSAHAGEKKSAGRCVSVEGALLGKVADKPWTAIKADDALPADIELVALPEAVLASANGKVQLKMLADLGRRGPLPVLESGVILLAPGEADFAFRLDRGLAVLANDAADTAATVALTIEHQKWTLTLKPKTRVGLELHARYAPGSLAELPKRIPQPPAELMLLVTQGAVFLDKGDEGWLLQAPPGAALVHWDSVFSKVHVQNLAKLPEAVMHVVKDDERALVMKAAAITKTLNKGSVAKALEALHGSKSTLARRAAVVCSGAIGDVGILLGSLEDASADIRDLSILVLRHYVGRGPAEVERLFAYLTKDLKLTDVQSANLFQLLLGFTEEELDRAVTYDVLFKLLDHPRLGVRELARWHLARLVPAGKTMAYDAAAPEAARQAAARQWRALVPEGEIPLKKER